MQMSLPGLHRSILFETLKHCPELIPVLFRRQWDMLSNGIPYITEDLVSDLDAQSAFEALTKKGSFPKHRFCFFIDGLDEYHGQTPSQLKLARDLQRWACGDDVKICASSRPYIEFDKLVTTDDRRFHLHDLTRHDIYVFSRKMIEDNLQDDLERVETYYLSLVERVVDKSEGVFLWARLVVCSLLEGLFRHDKEDVLERKLDVMPPDINGLYTELLDTLSPDDRLRAEKMLFLTAHISSWSPLGSVVYAFIDELSDPNFPPRDGKRPMPWLSTEQIAENVQLQLKSLTKGLLETVPMGICGSVRPERRVVQFFHRTVCDFVLAQSELDDTTSRFPWITKGEKYYRLCLAELILTDMPYRINVWDLWVADREYEVGQKCFRQKLPIDLLEGFTCTLKDDDAVSVYTPRKETFRGYSCAPYVRMASMGLSFAHLAAFCGQDEYVVQQTIKIPELLRGRGTLHILLSAAFGGNEDLVRNLLRRGSSPLDIVDCKPFSGFENTQSIPLWIVFTTFLVAHHFELSRVKYEGQWEVLELLLQDPRLDAGNPLFLVRQFLDEETTRYITLRQFIEDLRPQNADRLLALLEGGNENSYVNSARRFLLRFLNPFRQTDWEIHGCTRLQITSGFGKSWQFDLGIFGDLKLKHPWATIY